MHARYDEIGAGYARMRRPDPRIGGLIHDALGPGKAVLNVGAGTGSYEPNDRAVTAVEPSLEMIRARPRGRAPVVQASAEALPFGDDSFDASMAVLTIHHWADKARGLREMRRVTRGPIVILTFDPVARPWPTDYFPELAALDASYGVGEVLGGYGFLAVFVCAIYLREAERSHDYHAAMHEGQMPTMADYAQWLGDIETRPVPVPHDCRDGFLYAYWRRPAAYLDPSVRSGSSSFWALGDLEKGLLSLERDLATGEWERRYGHLLDLDAYDAGYRLIVATPPE